MRVRSLVLCAAGFVAMTACGDTAPPEPGTVVVNFSTNQGDENLFVWGVSVDGASPHTVSSNAAAGHFDIEGVSAGEHHLIASSLPSPCSSGADDRTVTVPSNDTLRVTFAVTCTRSTGDIALVVATSGVEFDLDGYTVVVDGVVGPTVAAAANSSVLLPKLAPGSHEVTLTGLAKNCTVNAGSAHTASVLAGQAAPLLISVGCVTTNGTIRIVTNTTASGISDPDGYIVTVGTAAIVGAAQSGTKDVAVRAGTYDVTLSDIEPNCTVPAKKQTTTVAETQTAILTFNITCGAYAATTAGVAVTDPVNDTLAYSGTPGLAAFDLLGVTTRYAADFMTITLRFSRAVAGAAFGGYIDLDVDENPQTGISPVVNDPSIGAGASQGVDQYIVFDAAATTPIGVLVVGTASTGVALNMIASGDSIQFIVPFEKLHDDGNLTLTTAYGTNHAMDYAPNSGVISSHVSAPAALTGSTASPALSHAAQPPTSARAFVQPAFLSCRTTRVLVASSCQAQ